MNTDNDSKDKINALSEKPESVEEILKKINKKIEGRSKWIALYPLFGVIVGGLITITADILLQDMKFNNEEKRFKQTFVRKDYEELRNEMKNIFKTLTKTIADINGTYKNIFTELSSENEERLLENDTEIFNLVKRLDFEIHSNPLPIPPNIYSTLQDFLGFCSQFSTDNSKKIENQEPYTEKEKNQFIQTFSKYQGQIYSEMQVELGFLSLDKKDKNKKT